MDSLRAEGEKMLANIRKSEDQQAQHGQLQYLADLKEESEYATKRLSDLRTEINTLTAKGKKMTANSDDKAANDAVIGDLSVMIKEI